MPSVLINIAMLDAHHRINMQELASSEITFCSTAPRRPWKGRPTTWPASRACRKQTSGGRRRKTARVPIRTAN